MQLKDMTISAIAGVRVVQEVAVGNFSRAPLLPSLFSGIEIEGENASMDGGHSSIGSHGWDVHGDDSLRDRGLEFVLAQPLNGDRLAAAITGLFNLYESGEVSWEASPRSGTHIHVNVSDRTMGFVQAFTTLVYCVDELIFNFADENRRWCSYGNSLNTLPIGVLRSLLKDREVNPRFTSWSTAWPLGSRDRYYGCNLASVSKFGTVELRYFPTPTSEDQLWSWMDLSHSLYMMAERFEGADDPAMAVIDAITTNAEAVLADIVGLPSDGTAVASAMEAAEELKTILDAEDIENSVQPQETLSLDELINLHANSILSGSTSSTPVSYFDDTSEEF